MNKKGKMKTMYCSGCWESTRVYNNQLPHFCQWCGEETSSYRNAYEGTVIWFKKFIAPEKRDKAILEAAEDIASRIYVPDIEDYSPYEDDGGGE